MKFNFSGISSYREKNEWQAQSPRLLSPLSPTLKTEWGHGKPSIDGVVPIVPAVPTKKSMNEVECERFEERAAILEFDGGLSRLQAEKLAVEWLGVAR